MLSLCYAQRPSYFLHLMFPSLNILQHYVEFNTHTIFTLKKLLGVGSFHGFFDHLVHHQTTLLTSSSGFGLPFVVRIVIFTFLEC
jgi:hypothetical protein